MLPQGWTIITEDEPTSPAPSAVPQAGPAKPADAPTHVEPPKPSLPQGWTLMDKPAERVPSLPKGWSLIPTESPDPEVASPVAAQATTPVEPEIEGLNYESLKSNKEFQQHLRNIRSHGWGMNPDEYSADENVRDFANYMRNVFSNEVSAMKFLRRLQNATPEEVHDWSKAYEIFESVPSFWQKGGAPTGEALADYAEGIVTAPSTALGVLTGGIGKFLGLGTLTATQAAIRGALLGGGLDALVAAGTDLMLQEAEKEMDLRDETDLGQTALSGAIGGLPGGAISGVRAVQSNAVTKQIREELLAGQKVAQERKALARAATVQQRYTPDMDDLAKQVNEDLDKFFRGESERGRQLLEQISPSGDIVEPALREDMVKAVTVAAKDLAEQGNFEIKVGGENKVGWQIWEALREGKIDVSQYRTALANAGLDMDDFKTLFWSELSRGGRVLNLASQVARKIKKEGGSEQSLMEFYFGTDADRILARLNTEIEELGWFSRFMHKLDSTRIGMMITQPATAMRNVGGATSHIAMDVGVRGIDNLLATMTGSRTVKWGDTFEIVGRMLNNAETREIAAAITELHPHEYNQLFKSYNEVNRMTGKSTGAWGVVDRVVDLLNIFNRAQDHIFRQSTFVASVQRQLNAAGAPDLRKIIADGQIKNIDRSIIERAMHDAHRITFTDEPTNEMAKRTLEMFRKAPPFMFSTFVPFPRFMLSAMKFQYEYSPLGLTSRQAWKNVGAGNYTDIAKVAVGTSTFLAALAIRNGEQGGDKWYEIIGEDGTVHDVRPYFPLAPYLFAADWYRRWRTGEVADTTGFFKEAAEAFGGLPFRQTTSYKSVDDMFADILSVGQEGGLDAAKVVGEFFANITSSFTTPMTVIRDIQAQFNPDQQYMRDARTAPVTEHDEWYKNFAATIMKTLGHRLHERMPDMTIMGEQYGRQTLPDRRSPLSSQTRQYVDPLLKQLTGVSSYSYKNPVEQEFDRLNIKPNTVFQLTGNPDRDRMELYYFADQYEREAMNVIRSPEYRASPPASQAFLLRKLASQKWEHLGNKSIRQWASQLADMNDPRMALRLAYEAIPAYERRAWEHEIPDEDERYRAIFGVSPDMHEVAIEYWYLHKKKNWVDPNAVDKQLRDLGLDR